MVKTKVAASSMAVIATAGHVDHGKSTLVHALTGMEPDRLAEERRRAMTIELGYVWTQLPDTGSVAFVDVPGHERFVPTMLAGVGPVPAVLFVVAADDPWMPQAAEHLAALDALGVRHGVVAVTRIDLADPGPASQAARAALSGTTLAGAPIVAVSARTGQGLSQLRAALSGLVRQLPGPDVDGPVRLWVDRVFTVHGAGIVVTGTLPTGLVEVGGELVVTDDELTAGAGRVRVRGMQSLGAPVNRMGAVARVALNVAGPGVEHLHRGSVLVTPDAWVDTTSVDIRVYPPHGQPESPLPRQADLHVGAARVPVHVRMLGPGHARLQTRRSLPWHIGDRALVRDPASRRLWGARVLDPSPPPLARRGEARARGQVLSCVSGEPDPWGEVERRGLVHRDLLRRLGAPVADGAEPLPDDHTRPLVAGPWFVARGEAERLATEVVEAVAQHVAARPFDPGAPVPALLRRLGLPSRDVLAAILPPPVHLEAGWVVDPRRAGGLPGPVQKAVNSLRIRLADEPFDAPTANELAELGLDRPALVAAAKTGQLLLVAPGLVLAPDAVDQAAARLAHLPQPFTVSQARTCLDTTRRVAVPLLEYLDRQGITWRDSDDRRWIRQDSHEPGR